MTQDIKPVKAWAVVDKVARNIDLDEIHKTKGRAEHFLYEDQTVIPVTITQGHDDD